MKYKDIMLKFENEIVGIKINGIYYDIEYVDTEKMVICAYRINNGKYQEVLLGLEEMNNADIEFYRLQKIGE